MSTEKQQFQKRILELQETSYRNSQYLFTDFLREAEYADVLALGTPACGMCAWGGWEHADRVVVRFGSPDDFGFEEPFPVSVLKVSPLSEKFAEELTHRDYLGALLNVGIERRLIGDILIDGKYAYVCCISGMADYIARNLTKVRHTNVCCEITAEIPDTICQKVIPSEIQISSVRLDAIAAHVCGLSREKAQDLFPSQRVFVNGRLIENRAYVPREKDLISVRGFGKFRFAEICGTTRKGKTRIRVEIFA